MLAVAAAVIERADGTFLLAQRPSGKVYAGWWEFPGGKVDPGESAHDALCRELDEELGIQVERAYPWLTRVHAYAHATVRLHFFRVLRWRGEPHPHEGQAIVWQRLDAPMVEPMLPANAPVLRSLALPLEYAITNAATVGATQMLVALGKRLAAGLRLVQVREEGLPERATFARAVVELARLHGARVLVNGDEPLARAIGADGVHWPAAQLMHARVRPAQLLCAASCHDAAELARAAQLECDFALLGPVMATTSHPSAHALGWSGFAQLAAGAAIPVYAIGGVRPADLDQARAQGAHGLAMIRGSWA